MKIGMTSLTLRKNEIPAVFEFAKEAGIEGIEWGVHENHIKLCDAERIQAVKALSKENNIEIFSLGSYCRMTNMEECEKTLETAKMLGAPIIRLWAGEKASSECSDEYFNMVVKNTKIMAEHAKKAGITLCFEYHPNTITDNENDALRLAKTIGKENVGLYWQPQGNLSYEQNLNAFNTIKPYVLNNIHLNNYSEQNGYGYLEEIKDSLIGYFEYFKENYNLLIEFVKDASADSLKKDADTLRKIRF